MSDDFMAEIDASIQSKLEADTDFQSEIEGLSDEDRELKIAERKEADLKQELLDRAIKGKKADELARNYKIRAEKAESDLKKGTTVTPKNAEGDNLSQKDLIALVRANVHDDDIDTVQNFAKVKGISIAEALKDEDISAVLEKRASKRKTAEVTNTGSSRKTTAKPDDTSLLKDLSEGKVPEKGSAEAEALFWARRNRKN